MKKLLTISFKEIIRTFRLTILLAATCGIFSAPSSCFAQGDRETWQPPEQIMDSIGVKPGMKIGEAGACRGYFTFPLAHRVGSKGTVFANDISSTSLSVIRERATSEGLGNIKIILGEVEDPLFPEKDLDMVIMVYVLHEIERPIPFLKNLQSYLKKGGLLVIIENTNTAQIGHSPAFLSKNQILEMAGKTDFELYKTETFLPRDNIIIYKNERI